MSLQTLGYIGLRTKNLDDWTAYASRFLGMQLVDKSRGTPRSAWTTASSAWWSRGRRRGPGVLRLGGRGRRRARRLAAHLESRGVKVARGSRALAEERHVRDLIVFADPVGNRLEVFHGAEIATEPFKPGRAISGFRTGPLGMGHAVLTASGSTRSCRSIPTSSASSRATTSCKPFAAYFFHINPRHHSLAFIETGKTGIHHLMVETCYLDDVGQAYDLALRKPEMIATTLGRHVNDQVTSFYSWSPSKFLFEYGWGGRTIDPDNWTPHERTEGPSLWGHDRNWLTPEGARPGARPAHRQRRGRLPHAAQRHGRQLQAAARRLPVVGRDRAGAQDRLAARLRQTSPASGRSLLSLFSRTNGPSFSTA